MGHAVLHTPTGLEHVSLCAMLRLGDSLSADNTTSKTHFIQVSYYYAVYWISVEMQFVIHTNENACPNRQ